MCLKNHLKLEDSPENYEFLLRRQKFYFSFTDFIF